MGNVQYIKEAPSPTSTFKSFRRNFLHLTLILCKHITLWQWLISGESILCHRGVIRGLITKLSADTGFLINLLNVKTKPVRGQKNVNTISIIKMIQHITRDIHLVKDKKNTWGGLACKQLMNFVCAQVLWRNSQVNKG